MKATEGPKKLTPAEWAYRDGVEDGRTAQDFGVEVWAFGPWADDYGRGVREGIKQAQETRGGMMADSPRVVILIDGDSQEILENNHDVKIEFIRWSEIVDDPEMPPEAYDDLNEALEAGDLDKAIRISDMLTAEPTDEGEKLRCMVCNIPITSAELCDKCAEGNDPFITTKYSEGARGPF